MMMVPDHKHSHTRSLMFEYTLNITTTWLFGELHNSMTKEEADTVQDNSDCASFGCGIRVRLAEAAILLQPWRIQQSMQTRQGFGDLPRIKRHGISEGSRRRGRIGEVSFHGLNCLPRVQKIRFRGVTVSEFHPQFRCLKTLQLVTSSRFASVCCIPIADSDCPSEFGGTNALAPQRLDLPASVLSFDHAEELSSACESLQRFETYCEDMPYVDTVNPHQLVAPH
jgi:hypothetical protein